MVIAGAVREPPRTPITYVFVEAHGTRGASPDNVGSRAHQPQWRAPSSRTLCLHRQRKNRRSGLVAAASTWLRWLCKRCSRPGFEVLSLEPVGTHMTRKEGANWA